MTDNLPDEPYTFVGAPITPKEIRMDRVKPYLKAVLGFITPGAVVVGSAVLKVSDGGTAITGAEWVTAVVACIVTGGAVYAVPNAERILGKA